MCCFPHYNLRAQAHSGTPISTLKHTHIQSHLHTDAFLYSYIHLHSCTQTLSLTLSFAQPDHPSTEQPPWLCRTSLEQMVRLALHVPWLRTDPLTLCLQRSRAEQRKGSRREKLPHRTGSSDPHSWSAGPSCGLFLHFALTGELGPRVPTEPIA